MKKQYRAWTQDQMYLMPPSMPDWLPEDHLVWFVIKQACFPRRALRATDS